MKKLINLDPTPPQQMNSQHRTYVGTLSDFSSRFPGTIYFSTKRSLFFLSTAVLPGGWRQSHCRCRKEERARETHEKKKAEAPRKRGEEGERKVGGGGGGGKIFPPFLCGAPRP